MSNHVFLYSAGCSVSHSYNHGLQHRNISHQYRCCSNAGWRERWVWKVQLCVYVLGIFFIGMFTKKQKQKPPSETVFIPGHLLELQCTTALTGFPFWCFSLWKLWVGCWGECHRQWLTRCSLVVEKKLQNFLKSSLSHSLRILSRYRISIFPHAQEIFYFVF